jgi:hypothetical protein
MNNKLFHSFAVVAGLLVSTPAIVKNASAEEIHLQCQGMRQKHVGSENDYQFVFVDVDTVKKTVRETYKVPLLIIDRSSRNAVADYVDIFVRPLTFNEVPDSIDNYKDGVLISGSTQDYREHVSMDSEYIRFDRRKVHRADNEDDEPERVIDRKTGRLVDGYPDRVYECTRRTVVAPPHVMPFHRSFSI